MVNQNNKLLRHELYPKALMGELNGSPLIRELLLAMKKMNSTKLVALLDNITLAVDSAYLRENLMPLKKRIAFLIEDSEKKNLNSEFDLSVVDTLRATVVSKRVQLSEKKSALTKEEEEYSKVVKEVHDVMERYFDDNLRGLDGLLLHEVFFYDLLSPHRDVSVRSSSLFPFSVCVSSTYPDFTPGLRPPLPLRNRARPFPPTRLPRMHLLPGPLQRRPHKQQQRYLRQPHPPHHASCECPIQTLP